MDFCYDAIRLLFRLSVWWVTVDLIVGCLVTGLLEWKKSYHTAAVTVVKYSSDGQSLLTASADSSTKVDRCSNIKLNMVSMMSGRILWSRFCLF